MSEIIWFWSWSRVSPFTNRGANEQRSPIRDKGRSLKGPDLLGRGGGIGLLGGGVGANTIGEKGN